MVGVGAEGTRCGQGKEPERVAGQWQKNKAEGVTRCVSLLRPLAL